jgi:hypothetical protein
MQTTYECTCCGKKLNPDTMVSLELDQRIGQYHDFGNVPEESSQGWFDFGSACAKKEKAAARKLLNKLETA